MKKRNIIFICFVFVVFIFLVIPLTRAVFKNNATSSKNIVAARWSVELNQQGISNNVTVISGFNNPSYTLNIVSESEVDVKYDVIVKNVPTGVQVSIDGENYSTPSNGTVTFLDVGTILQSNQETGSTEHVYFRSATGTIPVSNQSVTIEVEVSQIL